MVIVSSQPYNQGATTRDDDKTGFLDLSPHEKFQLALSSLTHRSLVHGSSSITPTKDPRSLVCSQTRHQLGSGTVSGGKIFRALQALSHKTVQTVVAPTAFESSDPRETLPAAAQMASSLELAAALPMITSSMAGAAEAAVTSTLAVQVSKQATTSKSSFNTSKFRGVTKHRHTGERSFKS